MFSRIKDVVKAFEARRFCIIFSEEENEADLACPADGITAAGILFMARAASGLICLALPKPRLQELEIDTLPSKYQQRPTPFYESVDAVQPEGEHSGISPKDRAYTIRRVIDPSTKPSDLSRPGHLPLLGAHADGLIGRDGHTEAVVELCRLAGLYPGGVLCEIISDRGDMATAQELRALATKFNIPIVTVGTLTQFARSLISKKKITETLDKV